MLGLTVLMGYFARDVQIDQSINKVIPANHPKFVEYRELKKLFGEDGDIMILAIKDDRLFNLDFYQAWANLSQNIKAIHGIDEVISVSNAYRLTKNTEEKRFVLERFPSHLPNNQQELNSIKANWDDLKFYHNVIYYPDSNFTIIAAKFNSETLNSKERNNTVNRIEMLAEVFETSYNTDVHISGLPFIRTFKMQTTQKELNKVLAYAILVLVFILLILFRSFTALIFPAVVVIIGIIWAIGITGFFGYKLTILTSLVPTLITIISIPNCIYLMNRYHSEYTKHGNKARALSRVIERIGYVTFFANLTTAIGFGAFYFTNTKVLQEFGIVAGITISCVFVISIICVPIIFSFLPPPKTRHVNYLDYKLLNNVLDWFQSIVVKRRVSIMFVSFAIFIVAIYGMTQVNTRGFILDDIPHDSKEYIDLKFLEANMKGVMPLEIVIDTKEKGGLLKMKNLKKIDAAQKRLDEHGLFSKSTSMVNGLKYATQAYFNGNPRFYRLPKTGLTNELSFIRTYLKNMETNNKTLASNYVDSTNQIARISVKIPDIGSHKLTELEDTLAAIFDPIFPAEDYDVKFTGTSIIAFAGFRYLTIGLAYSVLIAFVLIAFIMAYLFRSFRMLIMSLIPNLVPLALTAGIMGFMDIPLKPSTVLVFSVAFGISVDFTIHFLAKYKQELTRHNWDIKKTISITIKETGMSMIFTSLILFFGFITFTVSSFDGTKYLGLLVSITLAASLFSNLLLLPAMLSKFDFIEKKHKRKLEKENN